MKSKINQLVDYKEVAFEKEVMISCPEEHVQKELRHVVRGHKHTEKVEVIAPGDVAVLKLQSDLTKFNKPMVSVTVGGGLYDAELEKQVIGHLVGETFDATMLGDEVKVTVLQASRTVFPEATDEMVAEYTADKEELAGIATVAAFRNKVVEDYCERAHHEAIYGVMQTIADYVLVGSEVTYDEEEVSAICEADLDYVRKMMKQSEGKDFDTLTDEEIMRHYGIPGRARLEEILINNTKQRIVMTLWSAMCRGKDQAQCNVDDEDAMNFEFLENYVRENLTIKEER